MLNSEDACLFQEEPRNVLETGQMMVEQHQMETPQGIRWDESIRTPLRDERGDVIGVTVSARDITDRVMAEAERDRQRRMLQALMVSTPDTL